MKANSCVMVGEILGNKHKIFMLLHHDHYYLTFSQSKIFVTYLSSYALLFYELREESNTEDSSYQSRNRYRTLEQR